MFANLTTRTFFYMLSVLLVVALLSGAAPLNRPPSFALAQFSDDVFDPGSPFEHTNLTAAPTANFSANPTSGPPPLQVQFSDESTGNPTGWAWYFGDDDFKGNWVQMTAAAEWTGRKYHTSVALPDGSIVLMGGDSLWGPKNDVWRSTDKGATWKQMTAAAEWTARYSHTSVALPDGSIVLLGGRDDTKLMNDVWRSTDMGATWNLMTLNAGWSARAGHTSVVLLDGSIVLIGGSAKSDVWHSTDQGATWIQLTESASVGERSFHTSVALPDGSIVLIMGTGNPDNIFPYRDVWRSNDQGATWDYMYTFLQDWRRYHHASVALPDGSIVMMGGFQYKYPGPSIYFADRWHSTDQGANWTRVSTYAPWGERSGHTSVTLPDGSIVLMGGNSNPVSMHDVWLLETAGSTEQHPVHVYTEPGTYSVTLQVYNAAGFSSMIREAYISVTDTETYWLYLPLALRNMP